MIRNSQMRRHDWRLKVYLAAIFGAVALIVSNDVIQTLVLFLVAPALTLTFIILLLVATVRSDRRRLLWIAGAIAVFFASSAALGAYQRNDPQCIRSTFRWLLLSRRYKAEVLRQEQSPSGALKHIEWDGWGSVPIGEATMYLVYDPLDLLLTASKNRNLVRSLGYPVPCI